MKTARELKKKLSDFGVRYGSIATDDWDSFVKASHQHNKIAENEQIKEGKGDELWNEKGRKKSQKDVDARWTQKNRVNYCGYKNHVKEDVKSKLIVK